MVEVVLDFSFRPVTEYWWGPPTIYQAATAARPGAYFSHHTALYLHGLVKQEPETVYLNVEQNATGEANGKLIQGRIDGAFKKPVRVSNNRAHYRDREIVIVNGKNTQQFGVIERAKGERDESRIAGLERTLVDTIVRPSYSGGPATVVEAYRKAADRVDIRSLVTMLVQLRYTYPYHQAMGFYMERAGNYNPIFEQEIQSLGLEFDFYLDYQMENPCYSQKWRIYYPNDLPA